VFTTDLRSYLIKRGSARIPTYLHIHWLRQNFRFWICSDHLTTYTKLLWKPKYQSFWLIYKKLALTLVFQVLNSGPKNRIFQYWLYFTIFSFIVWCFEVGSVSNDRESFSLFLTFFESHFYEKRIIIVLHSKNFPALYWIWSEIQGVQFRQFLLNSIVKFALHAM
jgi:hypothetical protein